MNKGRVDKAKADRVSSLEPVDQVMRRRFVSKPIQSGHSFPDHFDRLNCLFRSRIHNVLRVASEHRIKVLVLGAWGCGVFRNDPKDVAGHFKHFLVGPHARFRDVFRKIVFAVGTDEEKVRTFTRVLIGM